MAGPKIYTGVSGKARQVKKIYVGVSSKARKIRKAYVGVGGKARLVYSSDWWLPSGLSASDCLAAYQFKGVASESAAKTDLTGHGYTLTKNGPSWSSAKGFWIDPNANYPYNITLYNNELCRKNIQTVVFRYANFNNGMMHPVMHAGGSHGYARLWFGLSRSDGDPWPGTYYRDTHGYPVASKDNVGNCMWGKSQITSNGVFGLNVQSDMYLNGNAITVQEVHIGSQSNPDPIGSSDTNPYMIWLPGGDNYAYLAYAFYSKKLTAAQHKEVCNAMNEF